LNIYNYPFDQFQRYKTTSLIINDLRQSDQSFSVLEIGANEHKNLEKFLCQDNIKYLDITLTDELMEDAQYLLADATAMPEISTDSFDIVVALDVYEHIPGNLREHFLNEINRVAKKAVILAGPFSEPGVNEAEIRANEFYKTKYGTNHIWLEEHISNGLPNLNKAKNFLNDNCSKNITHFKHGSLALWENLTRLNFEVAHNVEMHQYRQLVVDAFYNENIFSTDIDENCYRDFIICSDEQINNKYFVKGSKDKMQLVELNNLIVSAYRLSAEKRTVSIQSQAQQIQEKDAHIENQAQQIKDKDVHIENQAQQIQEKDAHIENQAQRFRSLGLKNRVKRFLGMYQSTSLFRKELPNSFAKHFDSKGYLKANPDIAAEINKGILKSGLDHFCNISFEEVLRGDRKLLESLPFYNDENYKFIRTDVTEAIAEDRFEYSHFVHYLLYGHREILKQNRYKTLKYIKNNPRSIIKGLRVLKNQGFKILLQKVKKINYPHNVTLDNSYKYIVPELTDTINAEIQSFEKKPLISIIMPVYNVSPKWLDLAIKSIESQWYENWELCIADDNSTNKKTITYLKAIENKKTKIKFLKQNGNISMASNEALSLTSGEYITLMDNDDELTPDALYEVVKSINKYNADFIYSDEDKIEVDGSFSTPHFKPDFSPDMFLSTNYLSHLGVIKKELITTVNGFEVGLEGAQDYDLYLKCLEHTDKIQHISKVLYHWRKIPGSTAAEFSEKSYAQDAGLNALKNAIKRRDINAQVFIGMHSGIYRIKYDLKEKPLVSIIIPFKDKPELLTMCIESILKKTTYSNFEIIGISNNSEEKETFLEMSRLKSLDKRINFYEYNVPFNYSDINNYAVNNFSNGQHIILLNNDVEIISPDWIESLLEFSQREDVGVVGAKLFYPNDTIQHGGVIIGLGGVAAHSHKDFPRNAKGYFCRLVLIQNLSALTAACFMIKKSIFKEIDGLNEQDLKIAFNDVDFCLRVGEKGYLNVFTPYCEAYHHESISRGLEDTREKRKRFASEIEYIKNRHKKILDHGDPFYNHNLSLDAEDFSLR
jgi:glycosyltransferase involved in cell wall biosynthesis/SAM-dependent methyltransferase